MISKMVDIQTRDGLCDTYVSFPKAHKELPIVLLYIDAVGLRQRIFDMADHIAKAGYYVLAPNVFYRSKRAPLFDYSVSLKPENIPSMFQEIRNYMAVLTPEISKRDDEVFLTYARKQTEANPLLVGAVGYCMGGAMALRAAGNYPNDFQAVASFHAGNLATDAETSPHRWFSKIQAPVYIGHADHDQHMPPEMQQKVEAALKEAHVNHITELYTDCRHGWTMADLPAYNKDGDKKHLETLLDFFQKNLKDI